MPSTLETPVLQVDANVIHKVDTSNPQNLFSMWTVFARCADSVAQGRRLENLSWRLWTRETFCVDAARNAATSTVAAVPRDIEPRRRSSAEDMPHLSESVDSVFEEEAVELANESAPMEIVRPRIRRQDSCASSRSRSKHITSDNLEKMVVSIVQEKEPLNAPLPDISPALAPTQAQSEDEKPSAPIPYLERSGSTTTESLDKTSDSHSLDSSQPLSSPEELPASQHHTTTVVRGFTPSPSVPPRTLPPPAKSSSPDSIPEPSSSPAAKLVPSKKQPAKFALGGSSCEDSLSDQAQSMNNHGQPVPTTKKPVFQVGMSSEEDNSLKSAMHSSRHDSVLDTHKKQTSFSKQLVTRTFPAPTIADDEPSDTEGDYDESAIDDDDDSSEWEDSIEDSGRSSIEDKNYFQRVDSQVRLPNRPSLITLMLAKNTSQKSLGNLASQSTSALHRVRGSHQPPIQQLPYPQPPALVASPNDSDEAPLMMRKATRAATLKPITEVPRTIAQPIMTTTNNISHQVALSPRTTRRNMLSTELTQSLRRHLLWERSQKTSTVNAHLKRRHTSHDVANLKQYPERPHISRDNDAQVGSWDQYLNRDASNGYHSKGW